MGEIGPGAAAAAIQSHFEAFRDTGPSVPKRAGADDGNPQWRPSQAGSWAGYQVYVRGLPGNYTTSKVRSWAASKGCLVCHAEPCHGLYSGPGFCLTFDGKRQAISAKNALDNDALGQYVTLTAWWK